MTDEESPDEKSPVEQALDLLVFAPLGLAMTARTQLPEMVAKGRAQIEGQITMARFIGQFAVQHGRAEVEKRLKAYTDPGVPADPAPPAADPAPTLPGTAAAGPAAPEATTPEPAGPAEPEPEDPQRSTGMTVPITLLAQPAPGPASPADSEPGARRADDLAIHGYDALSASQVVQRLAGLAPAELEQVRAYEAATRGRKTVLTKISQLQ